MQQPSIQPGIPARLFNHLPARSRTDSTLRILRGLASPLLFRARVGPIHLPERVLSLRPSSRHHRCRAIPIQCRRVIRNRAGTHHRRVILTPHHPATHTPCPPATRILLLRVTLIPCLPGTVHRAVIRFLQATPTPNPARSHPRRCRKSEDLNSQVPTFLFSRLWRAASPLRCMRTQTGQEQRLIHFRSRKFLRAMNSGQMTFRLP